MYEKIELDYNSLEPYIDDKTLDIHYNKHYQKYVDNLNKLMLKGNYEFVPLSELIKNIDNVQDVTK